VLSKETAAVTAPSSIDPARFLHEHLASASPDLLREMMTTFLNTLMSAEADAICGAPYGTHSPSAATSATATGRGSSTPAPARWSWRSPKLRSGSYFPDWLLERRAAPRPR
jgi:transposase-like protein